jgi:hypothetical protein
MKSPIRRTQIPDRKDFEEALAPDEERERAGTPSLPPRSYRSAALYSEQIEWYLSVFGRKRVHVVAYDDFRGGSTGGLPSNLPVPGH